jgi:PAS domain S-box-containing protein
MGGERKIDDEFFRTVADHIAHPIFVKDPSFRFVFLNRAFSHMVGFDREQMIGKTDYDFFPKAEADFFRRKDEEMFATRHEVVIDEEPITDARGERHVLATTKVPIFDDAGNIVYLTGIIHDITRLKAAEEELRRANASLEERVKERTRALEAAQEDLVRKERLAVLGALAGGVAHQIRNPLASIKGAAHVLANATRDLGPPIVQASINIIQEEVARANRIVIDLIDYARVRPAEKKSISAGYLVEQALGAYVTPPNVSIVREMATIADVLVDADQVQGALGNLVRNAIDALAQSGGVITASTRVDEPDLVIRIADTGPGLADKAREHLFEPLFTTKTSGLGLGLVTARALIESQGGRIEYVARPAPKDTNRPGAAFDVRLPLATPQRR